MATLVRLEVISTDGEIEVQSGDPELRKYKVLGGDHLTLDLEKVDDRIVLILKKAPAVHQDRGARGGPDTFKPLPPSHRVGMYEVKPDGTEKFLGTGSHPLPKNLI